MQILHPFAGSIQQYCQVVSDADRYRPDHCPQCEAQKPLAGHGFYRRTLVDVGFDGVIRVRRYLCQSCKRTVSLLPEFVLPYLRWSIAMIALFLLARLLHAQTLAAAGKAAQTSMPYQRGQFWIRRFCTQAEGLCAALAALTRPALAPDFVSRALQMLESTGWIAKGGEQEVRGLLNVPEQEDKYPQARMFGKLPSHGFFVRHVEGLSMRNLQLRTEEPDVRPAMIFHDVRELDLDGFRADSVHGKEAVLWFHDVAGALVRGARTPPAIQDFLRVTGAASRSIQLSGNQVATAGRMVRIGEGVEKGAVIQ